MSQDFTPQPPCLVSVTRLHEIPVRSGVQLRLLEASDADDLLDVIGADATIRQRVTVANRMQSVEDVERQIDEYRISSDRLRYVLVENGEIVGLVTLSRDPGEYFGLPPALDEYGFGYFLHPEARGRGLVTDSLTTLMQAVEQNLEVRQFVAYCSDDNTASVAVLTRLGFVPTSQADGKTEHGWQERRYELSSS